MAQHLIESGKVKVGLLLPSSLLSSFPLFQALILSSVFTAFIQLSRNQRFSASFYHAVETLVNMLMPHITQKYKDNLDAARNANHSLAVFVKVGTSPSACSAALSFDILMSLRNCSLGKDENGKLGITQSCNKLHTINNS